MLLSVNGRIPETLLYIYDTFIYLLEHTLNADVSQVLGALLFAWSLVIAAALFVYWGYVAFLLLASPGDELSDEEFNQLHWNRKRRAHSRITLRWFLVF